jgi:hypothetical protein
LFGFHLYQLENSVAPSKPSCNPAATFFVFQKQKRIGQGIGEKKVKSFFADIST